ncbi:M20/M25/M40 family metallo-hydrolase [Psychroflexus sp. YR1-1]|uniref:Vacuolar membrane protease n=1 Tax=Psychroflexus aurantiacus TaxID=2709310 RepID=A0A6B3QY42_9FLAO|nr:M20/M25/M40 family metallo-hydrolase [Psychroflexus aurantiacus]NEV92662.1 M20/M25/M40 family metallo-hydrolase [Psychroflexus aurantiacus]
MRKRAYKDIICLLVIAASVWYVFYDLYPSEITDLSTQATEFSTLRAFEHIKEIGDKPHYIGSEAHNIKRNYIVNALEDMDLEVQTQQGFVLSREGVLTIPENIITRLPATNPQANSKALLLLSHYDSAVHSSPGAADAASGVATILEAVRAFKASNPSFQNDIIIVFTDGEEVGLAGAELFAKEHPWIDEVGLALNFESRGSGGPSNMVVETNYGNSDLIALFDKAQGEHPLANSLMYSVYKLLPNDTDSTVFKKIADVPGFFFAFIDDHYDYHAALDVPERLDKRSLAHQGDYLTAALKQFSSADLSDLTSEQDEVYFTVTELGLIHYPFSWVWVIYAVVFILFLALLFFGFKIKSLNRKEVFLGFVPWFLSLIIVGLVTYFGWQGILILYPDYDSILQGFPYNGHDYIVFFVALALFITFTTYQFYDERLNPKNAMVAPLLTWFFLILILNIFLKGAAFFIIPLVFIVFAFFLMIRFQIPSYLFLLILILPSLSIIAPFIQFFPVGLGLKMSVISAVFTVLLFGSLIPVFGYFSIKKGVATMALLVAIGFFIKAHLDAEFTEERPEPNSLVYTQDTEMNLATWNTYDELLDSWTSPYFETYVDLTSSAEYQSKYNTAYTKSSSAPLIDVLGSDIQIDTLEATQSDFKKFRVTLNYRREVNRIVISETTLTNFKSFEVNGEVADFYTDEADAYHVHQNRFHPNLIDYYVVNQEPLYFEFEVSEDKALDFVINEISFDLLSHPDLPVKSRPDTKIPKPFVVNDAMITKQKLMF